MAHALRQKQLRLLPELLSKSCFCSIRYLLVHTATKKMAFTHAHLLNKRNSSLSRAALKVFLCLLLLLLSLGLLFLFLLSLLLFLFCLYVIFLFVCLFLPKLRFLFVFSSSLLAYLNLFDFCIGIKINSETTNACESFFFAISGNLLISRI